MTARYRLVWLIPDPFSDGRVPLGALCATGDRVCWVGVDVSTLACLEPTTRALASLVQEQLASTDAFHHLPEGVGPQVVAGEAVQVPSSDQGAADWVAQRVRRAA